MENVLIEGTYYKYQNYKYNKNRECPNCSFCISTVSAFYSVAVINN